MFWYRFGLAVPLPMQPQDWSLQRYVWIDKFTLLFLGSLHCYCSLLSIFFASLTHTKYTTFIIFFDFLTNSLVRRPRSPLLSNRTPRASSSLYVSISSLSHFFFSLPVPPRKICAKFFINIIKRRVRSFYYDFQEL